MTKNSIIAIIIACLFFLISGWYGQQYYESFKATKAEENSQVLLEKIKTVCKMVTVEGYFSEVYDYKDYWGYDMGPFQKKALMRIKAKVSVGYDMEKMKIDLRQEDKTILLSDLPDPSIIAIDHDFDYYDISEGSFNSFSEEDFNKMSKNAKEKIREQALQSDLMLAAEKQSNQMLGIVEFMAKNAGWKVVYLPKKQEKIEPELFPATHEN